MARPKVPLISKDEAIRIALRIIDDEGMGALNMRRLAKEMGVNGPSLYHHFRDKDAILKGVRGLVLRDMHVPAMDDVSWQEWLLTMAKVFRSALLKHPNTASLMVHGRTLAPSLREFAATTLIEGGVPAHLVYALVDSLECLGFGSALINPTQQEPEAIFKNLDDRYPSLKRTIEADRFSDDERFDLTCRALIEGWSALVEAEHKRRARSAVPRQARRRPVSGRG